MPSYVFALIAIFIWTSNTLGQPAQRYVPGEVIVKLHGHKKSLSAHAFVGKAVSLKGMSLKGSYSRFNMHHFSTKPGQSVEDAIRELSQDPSVEYAEPNYILTRLNVDEEISKVRYMSEDLPSLAPSGHRNPKMTLAALGEDKMYQTLSPASDSDYIPVVAVIDTGLDLNHEVFVDSGALWVNDQEVPGNGIDDDGNGYVDDVNGWNFHANNSSPDDDDGHGTHVAGIVLGLNGAGIDIFASEMEEARVRIMPLKFLGADGSGTTSSAIAAIHYAVDNGADILNNSWGGPEYSKSLLDAVAYSYEKGRVFVGAAGNAGANNDAKPMYPASLTVPHVMSIAATNDWDDLATFSNFGTESVDIGSPGVAILSTFPGDSFGYSSGTSMATPFVSGLAALMMIENPDLNGYEIKELIFQAAQAVYQLDAKVATGARLNLPTAVSSAKQVSGGGFQPKYDVNSDPGSRRQVASSSEAQLQDGGGCGMAVVLSQFRGKGPGGPTQRPPFFGLLVVLVLLPLVIMRVYQAQQPQSRRRHERYHLNSEVKVNVGGRELVGSIGTISLGGVSLSTDEMLEHGGMIRMQIAGPTGKEFVEVEGQVVWSEANKAYGVQFSETEDAVRNTIKAWTSSLVKSS